jgi:hypothetical protein
MPYWMVHAAHGEMPVYDMGAVEANKVHGWRFLNQGESPDRARRAEVLGENTAEQTPDAPPTEPPPARKKPGRPPKAK